MEFLVFYTIGVMLFLNLLAMWFGSYHNKPIS